MEQQTVEIEFEGELVGSCTWEEAGISYTLYRVSADAYVVLVTRPEGRCVATNGGEGFSEEDGDTLGYERQARYGRPRAA